MIYCERNIETIQFNAIKICKDLLSSIYKGEIAIGSIHSVFDNAINISSGKYLVTLLTAEKPIVPFGIVLNTAKNYSFCDTNLTEATEILFNAQNIVAKDYTFEINIANTPKWNSEILLPQYICSRSELSENIRLLANTLVAIGNLSGIGVLVKYLASKLPLIETLKFPESEPDSGHIFIQKRFLNFVDSLISKDLSKIKDAASQVIGFGTGLTPYMDDFICGIMIANVYLGHHYKKDLSKIYNLNNILIENISGKTTLISEKMLENAVFGKTSEHINTLVMLMFDKPNAKIMSLALSDVLEFGETSGTDTALGILVGFMLFSMEDYLSERGTIL